MTRLTKGLSIAMLGFIAIHCSPSSHSPTPPHAASQAPQLSDDLLLTSPLDQAMAYLPLTLQRLGWAPVGSPTTLTDGVVETRLLLPDGRTGILSAHSINTTATAICLNMGLRNDSLACLALRKEWQKVLDEKPKLRQGSSFQLP